MDLEPLLFLSLDDPQPAHARACLAPIDHQPLDTGVARTVQQLISDLPEQIAVLDEQSNILAVNHAWREAAKLWGPGLTPGHNYRHVCTKKASEGYEPAINALAALDEIALGYRDSWQFNYDGQEQWSGREFQICFHRIETESGKMILVTRIDVAEIFELRRVRDNLTDHVLESHSIERGRMARELHDSTSQLLTSVGLLLGRLRRQFMLGETELIEEMQGLLGEAQREIRTMSFLANPPALERLGMAEAMQALARGFARRADLEMFFRTDGEPVDLPASTESALYRIAQEALSNVHRHAAATTVVLLLRFRRSAVHFVIADDGVGIPPQDRARLALGGVGLASMRSRLSEIGGRLTVRRLTPGTAIIASVPSEPLLEALRYKKESSLSSDIAAIGAHWNGHLRASPALRAS